MATKTAIESIISLKEVGGSDKDLYRLGQKLQLEVDDILPILEAAKFMDFIQLCEGYIFLKPSVYQFIQIIQRDIDVRKKTGA